jgi:membrane-bound lytic murein transglycosylase A
MVRYPLIALMVLLLLVGCAPSVRKPPVRPTPPPIAKPAPSPVTPKPPSLARVPADQPLTFADDMDLPSLEAAIGRSLHYYGRGAGNGPSRMDDALVTTGDLKESLMALQEILRLDETDDQKSRRIRETFDIYQSTGLDGRNTVLFTGYFEAIMDGSLVKTDRFAYPVYRAPDDAVRINLGRFREAYKGEQLVGRVKNGELIPYYSRSEIEDQGSLAGRNLEIAWVDDRINLFFLHTQGSGKIRLPNG